MRIRADLPPQIRTCPIHAPYVLRHIRWWQSPSPDLARASGGKPPWPLYRLKKRWESVVGTEA